jgi:hypothetical protein
MAQTKIIIEQENDGFSIKVDSKRFYFEYGESLEKMVDVFSELGYDAEYEEVY